MANCVLLFAYGGATFASVQYSILPLLWVLLGGARTTLGPLIGTVVMFYIVDISSRYTSSYLLLKTAADTGRLEGRLCPGSGAAARRRITGAQRVCGGAGRPPGSDRRLAAGGLAAAAVQLHLLTGRPGLGGLHDHER